MDTKTIKLDIMIGDRYYCSLKWTFVPCHVTNEGEIRAFVERKLPTLKGKTIHVAFPGPVRWAERYMINESKCKQYKD